MPEIPRDPRQLARDILAGKISIEEIARQRQARMGGGGQAAAPRPAAPKPAATPQRIPKPVMAPPVQRQAPQQRPRPVQPQPQPQAQRPRPQVQSQPRPQAPQQTRPQAQPTAAAAATAASAAYAKPLVVPRLTRYRSPDLHIRGLTRNRETLRQAMIMSEILAKPIALRDQDF